MRVQDTLDHREQRLGRERFSMRFDSFVQNASSHEHIRAAAACVQNLVAGLSSRSSAASSLPVRPGMKTSVSCRANSPGHS